MSSRDPNPLIAVFVVIGVVGLGLGAVLAFNAMRDNEAVVGSTDVVLAPAAQPTAGEPAVEGEEPAPVDPTAAPAPGTDNPAPSTDDPPPTPPPAPTEPPAAPVASADIDDATIEAAMAEAATSPLIGLPSRDEIATFRIVDQLLADGHDLTGIEFSIYPASSADSFVLIETSDSSPLLASEEGETFILDLLESPILAEYEVERLVLQHSGVDEQGPALITMTVLISEFQNAIDTGSDVISSFAVQVERR